MLVNVGFLERGGREGEEKQRDIGKLLIFFFYCDSISKVQGLQMVTKRWGTL